MERIARRFDRSMACISWLPVSEYGDRDHRFGFLYDERDGTGFDHRPALSVDTRKRRRPDYMFLKFAHRDGCQSAPTRPGTPGSPGTADPSKRRSARAASLRSRVRTLERRLEKLERRAERLDRMSERFDEWESCLSWVPVTEYGDPDGGFGYLYGTDGTEPVHRPALAIDVSEWDDPDYEFLAFAGRDRPFRRRECEGEPGESVDKVPGGRRQAPIAQSRQGLPARQGDGRWPGSGFPGGGSGGPGGAGRGVRHIRSVHARDRRHRVRKPVRRFRLPLRCRPQPEARVRHGPSRVRPSRIPASRLSR